MDDVLDISRFKPHDVHSISESVEALEDPTGLTIDSNFYRFMVVFILDDISGIVVLGI